MTLEKYITKECKKHGLSTHKLEVRKNCNYYRCIKCSTEYITKCRKNLKIKLIEYKGGKCEICGYDKSIYAMCFHHKDPSQKDFGIGSGETRSLEKLKKEADKCFLLCANCHSEVHEGITNCQVG